MPHRDMNKVITDLIDEGKTSVMSIIYYVEERECQEAHLTPETLGRLFELYTGVSYVPEILLKTITPSDAGNTRSVPVAELTKIVHPGYADSQWSEPESSYLGKRYITKRKFESGRLAAVKLDGMNPNWVKRWDVRRDIKEYLREQNCRVLDRECVIEIDRKDGRWDPEANAYVDIASQSADDFQPLSREASYAKRQHCKECLLSGKRYDARRLGYSVGYVAGDENTPQCPGCYWYDPKRFNQMISRDFVKTR